MRRPRGEEGTVLVLVLGLAAVLMALVVVVVDVSAVVLAHRAASAAADGAAVAAAQELDEDAFYSAGLAGRVPLAPSGVASVARAFAADAQDAQPGLQLAGSVADGGTVAVVRATRSVPLPLAGWLGVQRVTVAAEARARSPLVD